jgi:farnesyl-diphosphate farnesyltransferase
MDPVDRGLIRSIVTTLTQGMEMDLSVFPPEDSGRVLALQSGADLDRYTYLVAGCVGEFWTRITAAHEKALDLWGLAKMCPLGVRFGKALQLTNILRDIPRDLRIGRCYLPIEDMAGLGLVPQDLLDPAHSKKARPLLDKWMRTALGHFEAAESYVLAIPAWAPRLRLAALWPLILGLATLERLARLPAWLDPSSVAKVKRGWVYRMMAFSFLACRSDILLHLWIRRHHSKVLMALEQP